MASLGFRDFLWRTVLLLQGEEKLALASLSRWSFSENPSNPNIRLAGRFPSWHWLVFLWFFWEKEVFGGRKVDSGGKKFSKE